MRKIEPHQKFSSSAPLTMPPIATPTPAKPAQIAIARGRSVGREHVGQDRQRRRHHERGPDAHHRTSADHRARRARQRREQRCRAEHDEAAVQREPSSVAVAERSGGQEQAREHEAVRVDDPLQRARRRRRASLASVGNATLRLALAITIITRLMHSTPSVHQRRSYSRADRRFLGVEAPLEDRFLEARLVRCSSNVTNVR